MARERERRTSPERSKTLLVTSHFAVAGVIAAVWGGAQFGVGREPDGQRSTVADHVTVVGMPVGASTAEVISVRVRLSAALQTTVREQNLSVTLPRDASVGTLLNRLSETYPVLAAMGPSVMVAVSNRMESPDQVLANGDIVNLVSQMAGG